MPARTNRVKHDPATIERIRSTIKSGQLVKRLNDHANGDVELSQTQLKACEILLRKSLPDLSAVTLSGDANAPLVQKIINEIHDPKAK